MTVHKQQFASHFPIRHDKRAQRTCKFVRSCDYFPSKPPRSLISAVNLVNGILLSHLKKKWSELWESPRSHQPKSLISSLLVLGYGWLNPNLFCVIKKGGTCEAGAANWRWFETYRSQVCKFQMGFLETCFFLYSAFLWIKQEHAVWNDLKSEHFHKWVPDLRRTSAGPEVKRFCLLFAHLYLWVSSSLLKGNSGMLPPNTRPS